MYRATFVALILALFGLGLAAADKPSDGQIHDLVYRRLTNDPDVKGGGLTVDVKEGKVTLTGVVRTQKAYDKAAKLAKKVKGVTEVDNRIEVKPAL